MSRFLNNILNKAIINNNYNIKNSFDLKQKLDIIQLNPDDTMVSFDIVSMYEKIPIELVYKAVLKKWDDRGSDTNILDGFQGDDPILCG